MSETVGGVKMSCSDTCGCPVPCPGGESCRCTDKTEATSGGGHKTCSCGEHCGCNPCTCDRGMVATGVGKANCRCAEGCTCVSCSA